MLVVSIIERAGNSLLLAQERHLKQLLRLLEGINGRLPAVALDSIHHLTLHLLIRDVALTFFQSYDR
jgi:hypothetical protein